MKYSKDGICRFDPETHSYFIGSKKLIGVTTYISQFKNKFDADKIAEKFALKNGLNKEDVLKKWKDEGDLSCINGTLVHDVFERYICNNSIAISGKNDKEKIAVRFINEFFLTRRLTPIDAEIIVYDENTGMASMIDCIAKNENGKYFILDWKTSKKIELNGYGKRMLPPYNNLPDANYFHYSLQLALYDKMYKEHEIAGTYIIHIDTDSFNIIKPEKIAV